MNSDEFVTFAAALKTYFPRDNLLPTEEAMELWFRQLSDIPYNVAIAMLGKWVATEKFPPSIAEIRAMCSEIVNGKAPSWAEAWAEVEKAIGRWGIYREKEALESMSPATRAAVGFIGWRGICMSENPDTIRAQFRQAYEVHAKRTAQDQQLPAYLKAAISSAGIKKLTE